VSPRLRWPLVAAGLAALVGLFLVLRPGSPRTEGPATPPPATESPTVTGSPPSMTAPPTTGPSPSPTREAVEVEVEVEEGRVEGPGRVRVPLGSLVRLEVRSDVPDEVHVHGYDLLRPVVPGRRTTLTFRADVAGVFEVELEKAGLLLVRLEVRP
jgi:hypothetical protein